MDTKDEMFEGDGTNEAVDDWTVHRLFGDAAVSALSDPELAQYLQELTTCRADTLAVEPGRLAEEKSYLQEDTENLAFSNYKTFIQAANCSKEIYDDFTFVDKNLTEFVGKVPTVGVECGHFLQDAQRIAHERGAHTATLGKHQQLLEILEIPQVMDTCVRAGYWEEALELAQFVAKLQRRLSHIQIIQTVAEEVSSQKQLLLEQLLDQLHTQLTLPQCLKVVGYLHRLGVFTEAELRIRFLTSRDEWFRGVLGAIPKDDPYQHITKVIELSRVHLFDACTQYKAVFSDDASIAPIGGTLRDREELPTNYAAIFQTWMRTKIQEFIDTLEADLSRGQSTSAAGTVGGVPNSSLSGRLDSILAQAMYFGLSFGRIGCDFRPRLVPIFEEAALRQFSSCLNSSTSRLLSQLDDCVSLNSVTLMEEGESGGGGRNLIATALERNDQLSPPAPLMTWFDLAVYCNGILSSFNELRLCLPLTIAESVTLRLQNSLNSIVDALRNLTEIHEQQWSETETAKCLAACRLIVDVLTPFLNRCLAALFPKSTLSAMLGLHTTEQHLFDLRINQINVVDLREILGSYAPAEVLIDPTLIEDETTVDKTTSETESEITVAEEEAKIEEPDLELSTCELVDDEQVLAAD